MVCRHAPGDRSCTQQYPEPPQTPDASRYEVLDAEQVGNHLVMKLRYPNCARCAYEGIKVLVFLDRTPMDALKWKRIDPHFSDPKLKVTPTDAPSPAARFPGSDHGWSEALRYAGSTRGGA